jgi:hypothetical protein
MSTALGHVISRMMKARCVGRRYAHGSIRTDKREAGAQPLANL